MLLGILTGPSSLGGGSGTETGEKSGSRPCPGSGERLTGRGIYGTVREHLPCLRNRNKKASQQDGAEGSKGRRAGDEVRGTDGHHFGKATERTLDFTE